MERRLTDGILTAAQETVMARVLTEEQGKRDHLVVHLSGAHAYGFPSPDSDLDLKAIHIARTSELLGLSPPAQTFDRAEIIDGVEIDYTSNELAHALSGILAGNGNFIERVLGRTAPLASPLLGELAPIVKRSLSKRIYKHYRGFAMNQLAFLEKEPTVKKLLYVFRTASTGIHALETGEVDADLARLAGPLGLADVPALIERKRAGERTALEPREIDLFRAEITRLFARLDTARDRTTLPDEPPNVDDVKAWLLHVRRARL